MFYVSLSLSLHMFLYVNMYVHIHIIILLLVHHLRESYRHNDHLLLNISSYISQ